MKTHFSLEEIFNGEIVVVKQVIACIAIIGKRPENKPYVSFAIDDKMFFIPDKDLERFAVNILKALGSKRLAASDLNKRVKKLEVFNSTKRRMKK